MLRRSSTEPTCQGLTVRPDRAAAAATAMPAPAAGALALDDPKYGWQGGEPTGCPGSSNESCRLGRAAEKLLAGSCPTGAAAAAAALGAGMSGSDTPGGIAGPELIAGLAAPGSLPGAGSICGRFSVLAAAGERGSATMEGRQGPTSGCGRGSGGGNDGSGAGGDGCCASVMLPATFSIGSCLDTASASAASPRAAASASSSSSSWGASSSSFGSGEVAALASGLILPGDGGFRRAARPVLAGAGRSRLPMPRGPPSLPPPPPLLAVLLLP